MGCPTGQRVDSRVFGPRDHRLSKLGWPQGSVFPSEGLTAPANSIAPTALGIDLDASKSAAALGEVQQKGRLLFVIICSLCHPRYLAAGIPLIFSKESPVSACARSLLAPDPDYERAESFVWTIPSNNPTRMSFSHSPVSTSFRVRWRSPADVPTAFGFVVDIRTYVEAERATASCLVTE